MRSLGHINSLLEVSKTIFCVTRNEHFLQVHRSLSVKRFKEHESFLEALMLFKQVSSSATYRLEFLYWLHNCISVSNPGFAIFLFIYSLYTSKHNYNSQSGAVYLYCCGCRNERSHPSQGTYFRGDFLTRLVNVV